MDNKSLNLWNNLSFKTLSYRKNYDFINTNENIITECEGTISEITTEPQRPPLIIGEYQFSIWDIRTSEILKINVIDLIKKHSFEETYNQFLDLVNNKTIEINKYDKIILIHTLILRPDYRKQGVVDEFVEMLYREYHNRKCAIIALVMPFQNNDIDFDFYYNKRNVQVKETIGFFTENKFISSREYYKLDELIEKKDLESNQYRLFAIANRCGFFRLSESDLFIFFPEKIVKRLLDKQIKN
jgi:hypothetical protein